MIRSNMGNRKKGTPDQVINDIKESYRLLIKNNFNNMDNWLKETAAKNPAKAFDLIIKLSEYIIPKLGRSDFDLKGNSNENKIIKVTFK
jgi:hypothetical protein